MKSCVLVTASIENVWTILGNFFEMFVLFQIKFLWKKKLENSGRFKVGDILQCISK